MKVNISGSATFNILEVDLDKDDVIIAQPRSMLSMTTGLSVTAYMGGIDGGIRLFRSAKQMLAGENFASAKYVSSRDGEKLVLAPDVIGPVFPLQLKSGVDVFITRGAYLAHFPVVKVEAEFAGIKGIISKKGMYLLKASGDGEVFLAAHGEVRTKELAEGERIVIDNDFVIAFEQTVKYELVKAAKGIKDSVLSGEGFVNRYTGPGKVYFQTRGRARTGMMSSLISNLPAV